MRAVAVVFVPRLLLPPSNLFAARASSSSLSSSGVCGFCNRRRGPCCRCGGGGRCHRRPSPLPRCFVDVRGRALLSSSSLSSSSCLSPSVDSDISLSAAVTKTFIARRHRQRRSFLRRRIGPPSHADGWGGATEGWAMGGGIGLSFSSTAAGDNDVDNDDAATGSEEDGDDGPKKNRGGNGLRRRRLRCRRISFLTDVEGDAAYFDRFVARSKVLAFRGVSPRFRDDDEKDDSVGDGGDGDASVRLGRGCDGGRYFPYDREVMFLDDHEDRIGEDEKAMLVYGGDVWDKGGSDLYVIRQLLSLKRRYGERVQFLMGNRDINKMRIVPELGLPGSGHGKDALPIHGGLFWLEGTGLPGDPLVRSEDDGTVPSDAASDRLRWILGKTMGSPDAFELRRSELKREREARSKAMSAIDASSSSSSPSSSVGAAAEGCEDGADSTSEEDSPTFVSDEDVVESYRSSCHPDRGVMGHYLSEAKLALRIGEVAFVHGALPLTGKVVAEFLASREDGGSGDDDDDDEGALSAAKTMTTTSSAGGVGQSIWSDFDFAMPWRGGREEKGEGQELGGGRTVKSVDEWIATMNVFALDGVSSWRDHVGRWERRAAAAGDFVPDEGGIWSTKGGYANDDRSDDGHYGSLLQYGMGWTPNKTRNPTVVYASWSEDGMPRRFYDKGKTAEAYRDAVREFFEAGGIKLMATGHQPNGDLPLPIRVAGGASPSLSNRESKVGEDVKPWYIIACDTSYSGDTHWINTGNGEKRTNLGRGKSVNGRGDIVVSELIIEQCPTDGRIVGLNMHGMLSDGSPYEYDNLLSENQVGKELGLVGTLVDRKEFTFEGSVRDDTSDQMDWWVKAKFNDDTYLVSSGKGYEVWNSLAQRRPKI